MSSVVVLFSPLPVVLGFVIVPRIHLLSSVSVIGLSNNAVYDIGLFLVHLLSLILSRLSVDVCNIFGLSALLRVILISLIFTFILVLPLRRNLPPPPGQVFLVVDLPCFKDFLGPSGNNDASLLLIGCILELLLLLICCFLVLFVPILLYLLVDIRT